QRAAPPPRLEDTLGGQPLDRFAQRRTADAQFRAQRLLGGEHAPLGIASPADRQKDLARQQVMQVLLLGLDAAQRDLPRGPAAMQRNGVRASIDSHLEDLGSAFPVLRAARRRGRDGLRGWPLEWSSSSPPGRGTGAAGGWGACSGSDRRL